MESWDIGRLVYLVLLGTVLIGWVFVQNRQSLGKTLQQIMAWVFIFLGMIAAVGLWDDIRQTVQSTQAVLADQGQIEVPRAPDGHYYLTLSINDTPIRFVVDTGATQMVLTQQDARRAGIDMDRLIYSGRALTANGEVRTAPAQLDTVQLGPFADNGLTAWVNDGDMAGSLLGMDYLQRWSRIEIADNALLLTR